MPFQFSSSILRWLKFFAGFNLVCGLAAAVWLGIGHTTVEEQGERVINPWGVLATFAALAEAILGTLILMALYWILRNVIAIHYGASELPGESEQ